MLLLETLDQILARLEGHGVQSALNVRYARERDLPALLRTYLSEKLSE